MTTDLKNATSRDIIANLDIARKCLADAKRLLDHIKVEPSNTEIFEDVVMQIARDVASIRGELKMHLDKLEQG